METTSGAAQRPVVGDVVHYASHGTPVGADGSQAYRQACRAAQVTATSEDPHVVSLVVFNPTGEFFNQGCSYDPGRAAVEPGREVDRDLCGGGAAEFAGGTWHYPASWV